MPAVIHIPNLDDLIERYQSGTSMLKLSQEVGISRTALSRKFRKQGVEIRGRSAAERLKWKAIRERGADAVARQVSAAHAARRGQVDSREVKRKRAVTRAKSRAHVFAHETATADAFRRLGLVVTQQRAVLHYNIDVALDELRIAVEIINTKPNRPQRMRHFKRTEDLRSAGWSVAAILTYGVEVSYSRIAKQVVAWSKAPRRSEAGRGEYWVAWGDTQDRARCWADLDHRP